MNDEQIIQTVRNWVENPVIELNLCPFAKRELVKNRVRFSVTHADNEEALLADLHRELSTLDADPSVETTLLIHPDVLADFHQYNQFLDLAEGLLVQRELEGVYQIASFHPDYQFGGTEPDDAENYTNRSPFPILHLLREASLDDALARYPDAEAIAERNIGLLKRMGTERMAAILRAAYVDTDKKHSPSGHSDPSQRDH